MRLLALAFERVERWAKRAGLSTVTLANYGEQIAAR
jgi:hypothetical protein